ncbi:MAG: hypothetical protein AAGU19_10400 [Prolixibacteraceae bacterium]
MKKTKEIAVGYELFTTVLLLITGTMFLIMPSVSVESLMHALQSGGTIFFLFLMTGLVTMCLILLPKSLLFLVLILVGVVQVLYGKTLPINGEPFKVTEILQQAACWYPKTVGYTTLGDSYKKLEETNEIEQAYAHVWCMSPSRFYSKCLLAKLYDESRQEKAVITAKESLGKQVKIESIVIEGIRLELEGILLKRQNFIKEGNSPMPYPEFKLQKW